jgi:3,4-dihydroxy 2-butanone 4-phosphate synthase / GTP cyclohydrolase II
MLSAPSRTVHPTSFDPLTIVPTEFAHLVRELQHAAGAVLHLTTLAERPLYGTTLYIANCSLDTRFGHFRAYVFQDISDKHYIIALAHGDVFSQTPIYTRIHSSCVTSEALFACDCDCIQQLEGAFKVIAEKGHGVLFYILQEGRGVGFMGKARDRMLVQASLDQISTFSAYTAVGLAKDHRSYDNIAHICYLLGIKASWILLTNNPDKLEAFRALGLVVDSTETLEFEPSPFNLAYLTSKAAGGHLLNRPNATLIKSALPPEPVMPFRPHSLAAAKRFIYAASYFLPIQPVDNDVLLTAEQFSELTSSQSLLSARGLPEALILNARRLKEDRVFVQVNPVALAGMRKRDPNDPLLNLIIAPYWFRVHVYYDLVTSGDFIVLTYGKSSPADAPVVRLHSESLFNRFPLRVVPSRERMQKSIKHIVSYGSGAILIVKNDGLGAGFCDYTSECILNEGSQSQTAVEAYDKLEIEYDSAHYSAAFILLKQHIQNAKIQMVLNSPTNLNRKKIYTENLERNNLGVEQWIFLGD